jgi:hypothetical protein
MTIQFSDYPYYPALRTRPAEITGYSNLRADVKNSLLPIMRIGAWPRCEDISESIRQLETSTEGRPFILDLTRELMYQNPAVHSLLDSSDDFKPWRNFVKGISNAIPVVQFIQSARLPQVIRQTRKLEGMGRKLAFRISDFTNDTNKVITALSAMDDPKNALVIIDAGYIRETMAASIAACISSVNDIREEIPNAEITVISTSYPASLTSFVFSNSQSTAGAINILERDLHEEIGVDAVIYGDHGSIHARTGRATGGKYTPTIDCALYDAWLFERRPNTDGEGHISAAQSILSRWPESSTDDTWGAEMLRRAASGDLEGLKTRAAWIAVRVNMHLTRQFELSSQSESSQEEDI